MPIELGDLKLYTVKELSEKLGVTIPTIREYLKHGKLRGRKMAGKYFVSEDAIKEYFDQPQTKPE